MIEYERSAGQRQISRLFPQYDHIGLLVISWFGSQFAGSLGFQGWIHPVTQVLGTVAAKLSAVRESSLANRSASLLSSEYNRQARESCRWLDMHRTP